MLQLAEKVFADKNNPAQIDVNQEVYQLTMGNVGAETMARCTELTLHKQPK